MLTVELPWPPSVNSCWRAIVQGKKKPVARVILSAKGREFREDAIKCCQAQNVSGLKLEGRLTVVIELYPPSRHRRDVDNYSKAALDALTHAKVWADDEQVDHLSIIRRDIRKGGKAVITIEQAS